LKRAVYTYMTENDRNIIVSVWNDMVLRNRLEHDPYSLTSQQLIALRSNDEINQKIALSSLELSLDEPAMKVTVGLSK
jgi:hypothetical protein